MRRTEARQGVRMIKFLDILGRCEAAEFSQLEAAELLGMSERTFSRRFREQTGSTPLQWLLRARVRRAQYLLENSDHTIERIAQQAGFGSPTAFRERFRRVVGTSPQAYRSAFHSRTVSAAAHS